MVRILYDRLIRTSQAFSHLFLLAIRLFWGWQFFNAGRGKFADIASIAGYFETLHIPLPLVNAYLVAAVELLGGAFLILGLFSRLASLPLIGTMVVAFLTAESEATWNLFSDPGTFIGRSPFTFLMAALTIFSFGPGLFSLDRIFGIEKK
ncbi:MAG: DoxX family protein [Parachlamydia sp.]|nr:DoxX family protein [Parachlamydia sp.]